MSWYLTSLNWIDEQRKANPGMTLEELKKHCSKNYPYSERRGWAYKAFLKAMRESFGYNKSSINVRQMDFFNKANN